MFPCHDWQTVGPVHRGEGMVTLPVVEKDISSFFQYKSMHISLSYMETRDLCVSCAPLTLADSWTV